MSLRLCDNTALQTRRLHKLRRVFRHFLVFQTIQKNNPGLPCKLVAVCLLSVKVGTVVIHTPQVKRLSAMASGSEGNFEASFQVLLIAFTWLAGASRCLNSTQDA